MNIVLCGAGALGSTALTLLRNIDAQITVVDFDRVQTKNLAAQAFVKPSLGKNKASALKAQMQSFYGKRLEARPVRLERTNVDQLCSPASLLIECFDNAQSRRLISAFAQRRGVPLLHGAMAEDASFAVARWDERFVADEEDTPGQPTCEGGAHLPFIGLVGAAIARCAQVFLESGEKRDAIITSDGIEFSL